MEDLMERDVQMSEEAITEYAAGTLSPAKHMIIACQSELSADVAANVCEQEAIAASLLDDIEPVSMSDKFMQSVLQSLPDHKTPAQDLAPVSGLAPKTLRNALGHGLRDMKWKTMVPGVSVYDVLGNRRYETGDRLYLLRVKGGMQMPEHSHRGEEWSLILTGQYSVGDKTYSRGDLHIEDERETHAPYINEGEDCICLIMTQGPLVMKNFLPKVVQKIVGI